MRVEVRKGNVVKAMSVLSKKLAEDGDLRRATERRFFKSKGLKRREALKKAKVRAAKEKKNEEAL